MKTIFYASPEVWKAVVQLSVIAVLLLFANVLKKLLPVVKRSLMPVSVLAGFIMLALKLLLDKVFGVDDFFDINFLDSLVYHCIALGFIAMSLCVKNKTKESTSLTGPKTGAAIVGSYLVQAFCGLVISILLSFTVLPGLFKAAGLLLPMGYGQGPGQANNVGMTYESYGFKGGQSFGLALAAAGYITACTVGVVVLSFWKKKNIRFSSVGNGEDMQEREDVYEIKEIKDSDSIDKLSVQIALVLLVYVITYLITLGLTTLLAETAPGLGDMLNPMLWGFNFIIGSIIAMLVKSLLLCGERRGLVKQRYQNNYLLSRLSGFFFDIMIVAGIACIDTEDLSNLWLPFILMAVCGSFVTWFYLTKISKRLYADYYYEGLISMYGMMTGTIGSGILLLREIDPEFKTPAASNLVSGSSYGIIFGAPLLILVTMAAKSTMMCYVVCGIIVIYFSLLMAFVFYKKKK